jgi:hypothetical protein
MIDQCSPQNGAHVEDLESLVSRARQGDESVVPHLVEMLDERPEVARYFGDLSRHVREAWLKRVAQGDVYLRECLRRSLEEMRQELAGPAPTLLERLLVDRLLVTWLQVQHADGQEALAIGGPVKLAEFRMKRADRLNRRFANAVGALATLRKLLPAEKRQVAEYASEGVAAGGVPQGVARPATPLTLVAAHVA